MAPHQKKKKNLRTQAASVLFSLVVSFSSTPSSVVITNFPPTTASPVVVQVRQLRNSASREKLGDFACSRACSFCLHHLPHFRKASHGLIPHSSYSHEDDEFVRFLSHSCVSLMLRSKLFLPFPSPKIRSTITANPKRMDGTKVGPKGFKKFKQVQNDLKAKKNGSSPRSTA